MPTWTVTSADELEHAFADAADGDRIELAPGSYDATALSGRDFTAGLTIASADPGRPAVFTDTLYLSDVSGVTVQGIDLDTAQLSDLRARIRIDDSTNVVLRDMLIEGHIPTLAEGQNPGARNTNRKEAIAGYGNDLGVLVRDSTNLTLDGLELRDLRLGVGLTDAFGITIRDADIHAVREGINMNDVRGVLIEDSSFHNFKPWKHPDTRKDDHPDMIQFWGANSTFGVHELTIRNNDFRQDPGDLHTQTIYGSLSGNRHLSHSDFTITGNTIVNGQLNAISINDVDGVYIADNILLPKADLDDNPRQVQTPGIVLVRSTDAVVENNTFLPYAGGKDIKVNRTALEKGTVTLGDNTLLSTDPDAALFWRKVAAQVVDGSWAPDGGMTDDGSADTLVLDPSALVSTALANGLHRLDAPAGGGLVKSEHAAAVLIGSDGSDTLRVGTHDSVMLGGAGADKFVFNFRDPDTDGALHVVADLDFAAGDHLHILGADAGYMVRSADRLVDLVDSGTLQAQAGMGGGIELALADVPGHLISLPFLPFDGFFDGL